MPVKLNASQLRILEFLHEYKHPKSGLCTPYVQEIAEACGVSQHYVRSLTTRFVQLGLLEKAPCWMYFDWDEGESYSAPTPDRHWAVFEGRLIDPEVTEVRGPNLYQLTRQALEALGHTMRLMRHWLAGFRPSWQAAA